MKSFTSGAAAFSGGRLPMGVQARDLFERKAGKCSEDETRVLLTAIAPRGNIGCNR